MNGIEKDSLSDWLIRPPVTFRLKGKVEHEIIIVHNNFTNKVAEEMVAIPYENKGNASEYRKSMVKSLGEDELKRMLKEIEIKEK